MKKDGSSVFGSRVAVAVISVIVTAVVVMGGIAVASVGKNSVTSKSIRDGAVKSVDIGNGAVGVADVAAPLRPLWAEVQTWSVDGGGPGPTTSPDALILDGRGAVSATRLAEGHYQVFFTRQNLAGCSAVAGLKDHFDLGYPGYVAALVLNGPEVEVSIWDPDGNPHDPVFPLGGFTVQVVC